MCGGGGQVKGHRPLVVKFGSGWRETHCAKAGESKIQRIETGAELVVQPTALQGESRSHACRVW